VQGPPVFPVEGTSSSNRVLKQRGRKGALRHREEMKPTTSRVASVWGTTIGGTGGSVEWPPSGVTVAAFPRETAARARPRRGDSR